jgi:hypothetical protein
MADIFLSYAKEDRDAARRLSALLERAGWTVWWDRRIPAGRTWRDMLEEALKNMRCMVVLWSSHSIESDWVKEEAEEARTVKKLVPVMLEAVNPPVGFRTIQAADLTDWDGVNLSRGARQLIADLESLIGKPPPRIGREAKPLIAREVITSPPPSETTGESSFAAQRKVKQPSSSGRESSKITGTRAKAVVAAAVVVTLALVAFALLRHRESYKETAAATATPSASETPSAPKVVKLGVHGARQELKPTETLSLTLRGRFSDGTENEIANEIDWSSSNPQVASVNSAGEVTAIEPGTTNITATHGGLSSSSWTLAVKSVEMKPTPAPKLTALTVNANKRDLEPQERAVVRVTGNYSDGSRKTLSDGLLWRSSDAAVASVNSKGELQALRAGRVEITAQLAGVTSAPLRLIVKEPPGKAAAEPQERKKLEYTARKTAVESVVAKTPEARPVVPQFTAEQLRAKIASYIERAKDFRVQGNYGAALAELATARATDPASAEVSAEIEQTKRACLAEKKLGRSGLVC